MAGSKKRLYVGGRNVMPNSNLGLSVPNLRGREKECEGRGVERRGKKGRGG